LFICASYFYTVPILPANRKKGARGNKKRFKDIKNRELANDEMLLG
jgi:hypothetical protein